MIPFIQNFEQSKTIRMENRSVSAKDWWGWGWTDNQGLQKELSKMLEMFSMVL